MPSPKGVGELSERKGEIDTKKMIVLVVVVMMMPYAVGHHGSAYFLWEDDAL